MPCCSFPAQAAARRWRRRPCRQEERHTGHPHHLRQALGAGRPRQLYPAGLQPHPAHCQRYAAVPAFGSAGGGGALLPAGGQFRSELSAKKSRPFWSGLFAVFKRSCVKNVLVHAVERLLDAGTGRSQIHAQVQGPKNMVPSWMAAPTSQQACSTSSMVLPWALHQSVQSTNSM